jgi:SAM-dependent methyltransferase
MNEALERERAHQDAWYRQAIRDRFFEREGFRRLIAWNLQAMRQAVPLTSTSRLLSLGCGTGEYELRLAPSVAEVVGIDLSAVAVAEARRRAGEQNLPNLTFCEGSLLDATPAAAQGPFDIVYALGLLHHLSPGERHALLIRTREWLAPGGWFYARDPSARGLLRRAAGRWARHGTFHSPNEAALDPRALCQELLAAGFRDPVVRFTDVLAGPLPWLAGAAPGLLWSAVFAFDRAWLATPGLRGLASQFDVRAAR